MKTAITEFFQRQWDDPKKRIWIIRIALFSSQALLIIGVAIFMWLQFGSQ